MVQFYLTFRQDPYQVLPLRDRVDLGAMAIKRCSAFPKVLTLLEPHHKIIQYYILDTRWRGSLIPLQYCSQCVLQSLPTGQETIGVSEISSNLEFFKFQSCLFLSAIRFVGIMVRVFANGPVDQGPIAGRVIAKTQKWYLMPPFLTLSIIRYGDMNSKMEQFRERNCTLPYASVQQLLKREPSGRPRLWLPTLFLERSSALPTTWCCSYRKGSLQGTFDFGRQLYYLLVEIQGTFTTT